MKVTGGMESDSGLHPFSLFQANPSGNPPAGVES